MSLLAVFRPLFCTAMLFGSAALAQSSPDAAAAFDVEAATQAYLDQLDAQQRAASDAYFEGGYWLDLWQWLYTLLTAWVLLHFGLSRWIRDWGERISRFRLVQQSVYVPIYLLLVFIIEFPFVLYRGYVREHDYGLSNLSLTGWFNEQLIGLGVTLALGTFAIAAIYWVIRKAPRTWSMWASIATIAMLSFLMMVAPVYIDPLFNDYQPLEEGPVRSKILSLARANAVPADEVYQYDESRQSKRISANVSGLFGTTRINLNDNLLNRTRPDSIEAVMGHEIGHYALNHGFKLIVEFGIVFIVGFAFLRFAFDRVNRPSWGVRGIGDIAGLPLVWAILSTYFFLTTPITNSLIRVAEVEADIYGLNAARQPDGWAEVVLLLSEYRKVEPGYWEEILFYDHPSGYNRIRMAMQWKKEHLE